MPQLHSQKVVQGSDECPQQCAFQPPSPKPICRHHLQPLLKGAGGARFYLVLICEEAFKRASLPQAEMVDRLRGNVPERSDRIAL